MDYGLTDDQTNNILQPLRREIGRSGSTQASLTRAEQDVREVIEIKLVPTGALKGLIEDPGGVQRYYSYRRGGNTSQGSRRP
jgi:hypothetical protein